MQGKVCGKKRHTKTEIRSEISELICGRIAAGENYNLTRDRKAIHGFIVMARFHVALRCRRTIHVTQGLHVNWGEPAFSLYCADKVCIFNQSGRHAKEMQGVGDPNSTNEGMKT